MGLEFFGTNSDWTKKGEKVGGARGSGALGGIYTNKITGKSALIKRDPESPNFDIAEYMSSKVFAAVSLGAGAIVEMMVPEGEGNSIPGDGLNVYVRSEFFDHYSDMFKDMDEHMAEKNKPSKWFRKDDRPLLMGTRQKLSGVMSKAIDNLGYQGFDKIAPGSLLVGDFDMHTGNIGVIREPDKSPQLKRIDFGWGFANLTKEVHPHSKSKHLPGQGPTNHFREFPRRHKLTAEFVEGLNAVANADLDTVLEESFTELEKYYDTPILQKWAQHAMPNEFGKKNPDDINLEEVKSTLKEVMRARQSSLKEFSLEIKLGLIVSKKGKGFSKEYKVDRIELKNLIKENPDYFKEIVSNEKKLRLRDKKLKKNKTVTKLLWQEIIEARNEIIKEAAIQGKETAAKDSVVFSKKTVSTTSINLSDAVDPITQAIRDEVITTQQLLLQQEIARGMGGSDRAVFEMQNPAEFQKYLQTDEGKETVAQVMKNLDLQTQMHKIESAGYKAVHSKFQDSFRNVDWGAGESKVRTTEITNDAGEAVCTLKETTIDTAPTKLALGNGKTIEVKNYRQIDFPKELATGNGPMHVSMALKDENGRNMPERDAVYFTAHYDDSGKLTEVSSPVPVKFMGKGDDAIGYIERNGKVFTLPITQGSYREMMREVAKNQGMNVDISQTVEPQKQVQDKILTVKRVEPEVREPQVASEQIQMPKLNVLGLPQEDIDQLEKIKSKVCEKPKVPDVAKTAVEMLDGTSPKAAQKKLITAVKAGDEKLVEAMMQTLGEPPEGKDIPELSTVALKIVYNEGMSSVKSMKDNRLQGKIERACGKIAPKAGIVDHAHRVTIGKNNRSSYSI